MSTPETPQPAPAPPAAWDALPAQPPVAPELPRPRLSLRGRGAIVAAATLVVALSGVGGYAVASVASGGEGSSFGPGGRGVPGGRPGGGTGFGPGGPGGSGGGGFPGGQQGGSTGFGQRDGGSGPGGG